MTDDTKQLGPLDDLAGYHFRRTSGAIRKHFEQATQGLPVRQLTFGVLSIISANPGIRQGEVGRMLDVRRANMVKTINELASADLVDRGVDAKDRRAVTLSLTQSGRRLLADSLARIRRQEATMLCGLDSEQLEALFEMLKTIRGNCERGS